MMYFVKLVVQIFAVFFSCVQVLRCDDATQTVGKILSQCKRKSPKFDECMKQAMNDLRPYFKTGIPELGVAPFDPHFASEVKQKRKLFGFGYNLVLHNVFERGWTQSIVTKYKQVTNWDEGNIIYSQYFPEKTLEGQYHFKSDVFEVERTGSFNMTLRDYSQTTRVKRNSTGVDVKVHIDRIGDMDLRITNLVQGTTLERWLDGIINASWRPGLVIIRPLINDLVSTAFTEIFGKSFKNFDVQRFIID